MMQGPCLVEFDAKIWISPHLKQKNVPDRIYHISTGCSNCARAEATSLVRETRAKVGDLKGKIPHAIVQLRVLVQKHKSA